MTIKDLKKLIKDLPDDMPVFVFNHNENTHLPNILSQVQDLQMVHEFQGKMYLEYAQIAKKNSTNPLKAFVLCGMVGFGFPDPSKTKEH